MTQHPTSHQNYMNSNVWKCHESPSGAHHWVGNKTLSNGEHGFRCIHCGKENEFSTAINKAR